MTARAANIQMGAEHRLKITNSNILSYLIKAAEGEIEMTPVRAQISIALLKKVMPDLQSVAHEGELKHDHTLVFSWLKS